MCVPPFPVAPAPAVDLALARGGARSFPSQLSPSQGSLLLECEFCPSQNTPPGATAVDAVRAAVRGFESGRLAVDGVVQVRWPGDWAANLPLLMVAARALVRRLQPAWMPTAVVGPA